MMIIDQINLSGTSPLVGASRCDAQDAVAQRPYQSAPEFTDMTNAYSPRLRENFRRAASKIDMLLHEGIHADLLGPQYESCRGNLTRNVDSQELPQSANDATRSLAVCSVPPKESYASDENSCRLIHLKFRKSQ